MSTDPVFMKIGSQYYWYHNDHLGTPQKLTTSSGAVVWSAKYSSFGEAVVDSSSTVVNLLRFPGQYEDAETGLYYNYQRYFNIRAGRYNRKDPAGLVSEENWYSYVQNNPLSYIDPWGLKAVIYYKRYKTGGTITAVNSYGHEWTAKAYDRGANTSASPIINDPQGFGTDPYGTNHQIPPGVYQVYPKPVSPHKGRPSVSNTGHWKTVVTPLGTKRTYIQLHKGQGPYHSAGCIVSPDMDRINAIIETEYNNGGVTLIVEDVADPPQQYDFP